MPSYCGFWSAAVSHDGPRRRHWNLPHTCKLRRWRRPFVNLPASTRLRATVARPATRCACVICWSKFAPPRAKDNAIIGEHLPEIECGESGGACETFSGTGCVLRVFFDHGGANGERVACRIAAN